MVISITSLKGGVGKSTSKYKVCIVDADENQHAIRWSGLRSDNVPAVPVFGLPDGSSLVANIKHLNNDYEVIIIDGRPSLSKITSKIILLADFLIVPLLPSSLDVWATEQFLIRYQDAKEQKEEDIPACFLLNRDKPNTNFSKEVKEVLKDTHILPLMNSLKDRIAYSEAPVQGLGVYEYKDEKAKREFMNVLNELMQMLQNVSTVSSKYVLT